MASLTVYKTDTYKNEYKKIFSGLYTDFQNRAVQDYNFELEPLSYDKFTESLEKGLLECIILFEDDVPTGFLVYTTLISEALELNIIHCIGSENINEKRKLLLEKFLEINKQIMKEKIVSYPMLGKQNSFENEITDFGFKAVNTSVLTFDLSNRDSVSSLKVTALPELPKEYMITNWKNYYFREASDILCKSFKDSSDCLFDSRFSTVKGCRDIVYKITENVYGKFLPDITKVLLYKRHPVGFCFANMTNDKLANIPIVSVLKQHRGHSFGAIMLKELVSDLITGTTAFKIGAKRLNVSCDSDNLSAVNMYKTVGFTTDYTYIQAYRPKD